MESITDLYYGEPKEDPPEHDSVNSLAYSGLRARLRSDHQLLRSKGGSGLKRSRSGTDYIGNGVGFEPTDDM
jgi:hypothetical protein